MSVPPEEAEQKTAPPEEVVAMPPTIIEDGSGKVDRVWHKHGLVEEHVVVLFAFVLTQAWAAFR